MADSLLPIRPVLHLSGAKLRAALEQVIVACDSVGGIERFVAAVKLRSDVFRERIGDGSVLTLSAFDELLPLMPTVRRRAGAMIARVGWAGVQRAIIELMSEAQIAGSADVQICAFEASLMSCQGQLVHGPTGEDSNISGAGRGVRSERFLRDLAAEVLHAVYPERFPLMTRWVWDAKANTGVLRQIWHDPRSGDDTDHIVIDVPDSYETFLVLREELSQFMADNGIFRDMIWYVDVLQAQVYSIYINAQGGAYLKGDFQAVGDPLEHTRRILGLDRIQGRESRRRASIDTSGHDIDSVYRLN